MSGFLSVFRNVCRHIGYIHLHIGVNAVPSVVYSPALHPVLDRLCLHSDPEKDKAVTKDSEYTVCDSHRICH